MVKDDFNKVNRKIIDLEKYVCSPDSRESVNVPSIQTNVEIDKKGVHRLVEKKWQRI